MNEPSADDRLKGIQAWPTPKAIAGLRPRPDARWIDPRGAIHPGYSSASYADVVVAWLLSKVGVLLINGMLMIVDVALTVDSTSGFVYRMGYLPFLGFSARVQSIFNQARMELLRR